MNECDIALIPCKIPKGLRIKASGCVLKRVLDAKMAIMAIPMDRDNEIFLYFILFGITDIWKTEDNFVKFWLLVLGV